MTVLLAQLSSAFVAAIVPHLDSDSTLTVHDRDGLPQQPAPPYAAADFVPTGFGWHEDLTLDTDSGVVAVQFTGVGRSTIAALWCLDQIRAAVAATEPGEITAGLTGSRCTKAWSSGSPSPPITDGSLTTVTETYYLHLTEA